MKRASKHHFKPKTTESSWLARENSDEEGPPWGLWQRAPKKEKEKWGEVPKGTASTGPGWCLWRLGAHPLLVGSCAPAA